MTDHHLMNHIRSLIDAHCARERAQLVHQLEMALAENRRLGDLLTVARGEIKELEREREELLKTLKTKG